MTARLTKVESDRDPNCYAVDVEPDPWRLMPSPFWNEPPPRRIVATPSSSSSSSSERRSSGRWLWVIVVCMYILVLRLGCDVMDGAAEIRSRAGGRP